MLDFFVCMNLIGSIFFLIHNLLIPFEKRILPPHIRVFTARFNLLLFFFPFPLFSNHLRRMLDQFNVSVPVNTNPDKAIKILTDGTVIYPTISFLALFLLVLWSGGLFIKLIKFYVIDAYKFRQICYKSIVEEVTDKTTSREMMQILSMQNSRFVRKKIQIFKIEGLAVPYVSGIFSPKLFLPAEKFVPDHIYTLILRHELAHIKHCDLLFQRLSLFASVLYWYNPVIYLLRRMLSCYDELSADETALNNATYEDRLQYGNFILDMMSTIFQKDNLRFIKKFVPDEKKILKERISFMKNSTRNRNTKLKNALNLFIIVVIFSISSLPAITYADFYTITDKTNTFSGDDDSLDTFSYDEPGVVTGDEMLLSEYSAYFIDEQGNIYPDTTSKPRSLCSHSYVSGLYTKHISNAGGGCSVEQYNARRCKYCGNIIFDSLYSTITYSKCPHK